MSYTKAAWEPENLSELASSGIEFNSETLRRFAAPLFELSTCHSRRTILEGAGDSQIEEFCHKLGVLALQDSYALEVLSHLASILYGDNPAIAMLRRIGKTDTGIDAAVSRMLSSVDTVRFEAVITLAIIGGNRVADPLIAALNDPWYKVREYAAGCLGVHDPSKVLTPLCSALVRNCNDDDLVREIVGALSQLNDRRCTEALRKYIELETEKLRRCLVQCNAPEYISRLKDDRFVYDRFPDSSLVHARDLLDELL